MSEPYKPLAKCGTCDRTPGLHCRAHYTEKIATLEQQLAEARAIVKRYRRDIMSHDLCEALGKVLGVDS